MGHSTHQIAHSTGLNQSTISRLCSKHCQNLPKLSGGCPAIMTPTDMHHVICLIGTGKAENAVQITKTLQDIKNHSISPQTVCHHLRKAGMKAVVKQKHPLLSKCHRREQLDFAFSHEDRTVEDWKCVIWSHETYWSLGSIYCTGGVGQDWGYTVSGVDWKHT